VSFYLDDISAENLIYREFEVFVPAGESTAVSHNWVADVSGAHTIIVDITDSDPPESDLTNNTASKCISISEPQGKLKVKASSDKQKYVIGVDDQADIIVKVTYLGELIEGATVSAWVIDPGDTNSSVPLTEASPGIYTGTYFFTNGSTPGTYRIKAVASKAGYINGENDDSKDKFFLDSPGSNLPEVLSGDFSENVLNPNPDVVIEAFVSNPDEVDSIYGTVIKHGTRPVYALPLHDDGTHGDATPGDGFFANLLSTNDMKGSYTLDICINDRTSENRDVLIVNSDDMIAFETFTGLQTSSNTLDIISADTNITLNIATVTDMNDISFTFIEHRTESEGKSIEIIPSTNVQTAMITAQIEVSYTDSDIPEGVNETEMRLHVWDMYSGELEPLVPGGVIPAEEIIWGDTDHFSNFTVASNSDYNIQLQSGWNLISLPLEQSNPYAILEVLETIDGKWDRIQAYDPTDDDHWIHYNVNWPSFLNELDGLDHTIGFWIHITDPNAVLTVTGSIPVSTSIQLYAGWNLVGYPSFVPQTVADALSSTGADQVEVFDSGEPYNLREVASDYLMTPGQGYWIHVPADTVWVLS
jgi:hypothetical protein